MVEINKEPELDLETIIDESNSKEGTLITIDDNGKQVKTESSKENTQPTAEETIEFLRKEVESAKVREAEKNDRLAKLEADHQTEVKKSTSAIDDVFKARETSVDNAISSSKNELDSIKRQLKTARETGDIDKEIDLEEKLADARYQYNANLWEKNNIAEAKKKREETAKSTVKTDGARQFSSREQKWVSEHPRYNTDDDYQAYVWSIDSQAKKKGIIPDTDAYYEYLNTRLDKMFPENSGGQTVTVAHQKQATASTAAPVTRAGGSNGASSNSTQQIRLTSEQLEAAEFMGMSPVEYAQDLINQQKEKGR